MGWCLSVAPMKRDFLADKAGSDLQSDRNMLECDLKQCLLPQGLLQQQKIKPKSLPVQSGQRIACNLLNAPLDIVSSGPVSSVSGFESISTLACHHNNVRRVVHTCVTPSPVIHSLKDATPLLLASYPFAVSCVPSDDKLPMMRHGRF